MYVRTVNFRGAKNIDAGLDLVREKVIPLLNQQAGYRGITVSGNRAEGVIGVLTMWETAEARDASDSALRKVREESIGVIGGELSVDTFEQVLQEVSSPPGPGSSLAIQFISMDQAKVDENLAFFRANVLPEIKASPGFKAVRQLINRQTGEGLVGTVWADEASRDENLKQREARRATAAGRGVEFGELSLREVLLVDLKS